METKSGEPTEIKIYSEETDIHGKDYDCYVFDFTENREMAIYEFGSEKCFPLKNFGSSGRHFWLIHFVLSGEGRVVVGGKEYRVRKNQVFLQRPHEKIFYEADEKSPWEYCWIGFNGTRAEGIMDDINFAGKGPVLTVPSPAEFHGFFKSVLACYKSKSVTSREIKAVAYLYLMLAFLQEKFPVKNRAREAQENRIFVNMLRYIESNYAKVTVSLLSSAFYYERSSVYRLFKKKLGVSPNEYLGLYRLYRACNILRETDTPITKVAYSVGFDNYNWFFLFFKKRLGVTPENYLKLGQAEREETDKKFKVIEKAKTACRETESGRHINLSETRGDER